MKIAILVTVMFIVEFMGPSIKDAPPSCNPCPFVK